MTVIWIIFAPIYYLSRLPIFQADCKDKLDFNSKNEKKPL